jgi:hypothetical protein
MFGIRVHGLPWGHDVGIRIALAPPIVDGWIDFRLPRAQLDAAIARLAQVPGIEL